MCLVVRKQGEHGLFVFSDKSYNLSRRSLEPFQKSQEIPSDKFYIQIRLMAVNLDMIPVWVKVENYGPSAEIKFEEVLSPLEKKTMTA